MFTVLYKHADGTEEFFEARAVNYLPPEYQTDLCSPSQSSEIEGGKPGMYLTLVGDSQVVTLYREHPRKAAAPTPEVFVMNRDGKTVAHYFMN